MTIKVTDAMIDAAYTWAKAQSSMVDFIGEDELRSLCKQAFLVMWDAGYKDCTPVEDTGLLTPREVSAKVQE